MMIYRLFWILCGLGILNLFLLPVRVWLSCRRAQHKREKAQAARASIRDAPKVSLEKPAAPKRKVGRPRKNPPPDPNAPKRPVGRPRKTPPQRPAIIPADKPADLRDAQEAWSAMLAEWNARKEEPPKAVTLDDFAAMIQS